LASANNEGTDSLHRRTHSQCLNDLNNAFPREKKGFLFYFILFETFKFIQSIVILFFFFSSYDFF
jgi:hypothetical protein